MDSGSHLAELCLVLRLLRGNAVASSLSLGRKRPVVDASRVRGSVGGDRAGTVMLSKYAGARAERVSEDGGFYNSRACEQAPWRNSRSASSRGTGGAKPTKELSLESRRHPGSPSPAKTCGSQGPTNSKLKPQGRGSFASDSLQRPYRCRHRGTAAVQKQVASMVS